MILIHHAAQAFGFRGVSCSFVEKANIAGIFDFGFRFSLLPVGIVHKGNYQHRKSDGHPEGQEDWRKKGIIIFRYNPKDDCPKHPKDIRSIDIFSHCAMNF